MKKITSSVDILAAHFKKLQKENPSFSKRALGLKLGFSHAFLINVLNGKRPLPLRRVDDFCEKLKIDSYDKEKLKYFLSIEKAKVTGNERIQRKIKSEDKQYKETEILPEGHFKLLKNWWNLAILDLVACHKSKGLSEEEILKRVPVSLAELKESIAELVRLNLLSRNKNQNLVKTKQMVRLATRGPNDYTKAFYRSALLLAQNELKKTEQKDFDKRLITTISCSVNPAQIPLAKKRLVEALREVRDILTEGECTDVFFLQAQLFGVLKD